MNSNGQQSQFEMDRPIDAFQSLAHPDRIRIISTLAETDCRDSPGLTYSTLQDRVGITDNGRLNYHLNYLIDHFVEKIDDSYVLRSPGRHAYQTVVAGQFSDWSRSASFSTNSKCCECGTTLHAFYYYDHVLYIECPDCGSQFLSETFPPNGVAQRSHENLLRAVNQYVRRNIVLLSHSICPDCSGLIMTDVTTTPREYQPSDCRPLRFAFVHECETCHMIRTTTVGETLLSNSQVIAFYHDHGIDIMNQYVWELEFAATDHLTRIRSRDPWRFEIRPQIGNHELVVVIDEDTSVSGVSRYTKFTVRDAWYQNSVDNE
jgi:DNA-directed RNA polymerase subunit RPC12/RpoP